MTTHDPGPSPSPPIHMEIPWTYSNLFTFGTPQTPAPLDLDIYWQAGDCYHPQTKFAKVMFSQVSVCPRGVSAPLHARIHPPGQTTPGQTPPGQTTPMADTPLGRHTPPAQCMLGYRQQAGGAHPIGMHSCFFQFSLDIMHGDDKLLHMNSHEAKAGHIRLIVTGRLLIHAQ